MDTESAEGGSGPVAGATESVAVESEKTAAAVAGRSRRGSIGPYFQRYGVLVAFALVIVFFTLEKSGSFATLANLRSVLSGAAPLAVIAAVLTVPMMMGDFDLSVGYNAQVLGAVAVTLMSFDGYSAGTSIVITLAIGALIGFLLGSLIAWSKVSAFVITLGAGILLQGIEFRITAGHTIFEGLSQSYINLAQRTILTFALPVWIALVVSIILWYITRHTVLGRRMAAVGGNQEAAAVVRDQRRTDAHDRFRDRWNRRRRRGRDHHLPGRVLVSGLRVRAPDSRLRRGLPAARRCCAPASSTSGAR